MTELQLDKRMKCIADCVPDGAILADIGTDHGKLPVYLAMKGRIKRAVAADINEMPLQKAVNNIKKHGLTDVIETCLTDGLKGIEKFTPDCVVIAGMGGELIEQILEESTLPKGGVKYVLQPMTKEDSLSRYLCKNGYVITDEHIVFEGKLYRIICAEYTGEITQMTESMHYLGRKNIEKGGEMLIALTEKVLERTEVKVAGRRMAGLDVTEEKALLAELQEIKFRHFEKKEGETL
ncbi:MAG: SAM-dependent methyltransferase [Clostridia bacterium]|nr:SAM-dependent methyltransferase [Clostridia bacterium]